MGDKTKMSKTFYGIIVMIFIIFILFLIYVFGFFQYEFQNEGDECFTSEDCKYVKCKLRCDITDPHYLPGWEDSFCNVDNHKCDCPKSCTYGDGGIRDYQK
jgi:hypothetical protein